MNRDTGGCHQPMLRTRKASQCTVGACLSYRFLVTRTCIVATGLTNPGTDPTIVNLRQKSPVNIDVRPPRANTLSQPITLPWSALRRLGPARKQEVTRTLQTDHRVLSCSWKLPIQASIGWNLATPAIRGRLPESQGVSISPCRVRMLIEVRAASSRTEMLSERPRTSPSIRSRVF